MQVFGTSGIRQAVDRDLVQLALQVGLAVGNIYSDVVVGGDTRTSSCSLKHALISGLLAGGANCSDCGVLPTPTLAYVASQFKAGVMVTASHNPPEYNGMKLLNPDGSAFHSSQRQQIEKIIRGNSSRAASWET